MLLDKQMSLFLRITGDVFQSAVCAVSWWWCWAAPSGEDSASKVAPQPRRRFFTLVKKKFTSRSSRYKKEFKSKSSSCKQTGVNSGERIHSRRECGHAEDGSSTGVPSWILKFQLTVGWGFNGIFFRGGSAFLDWEDLGATPSFSAGTVSLRPVMAPRNVTFSMLLST